MFFVAAAGACSGDFSTHPGTQRLVVDIINPPGVDNPTGTPQKPLALKIDEAVGVKIQVRALLPDGTQDVSFNRFVRISAKPGAVAPLTGEGTDGRNVLVNGGVSAQVDMKVTNAFGTTYIVADDLGYIPADPLRKGPDGNPDPPKCSNGQDDDHNGLNDFPADPGCAFANDDSEEGGSYDEGVSEPIYFRLPRIADARGLPATPRTTARAAARRRSRRTSSSSTRAGTTSSRRSIRRVRASTSTPSSSACRPTASI